MTLPQNETAALISVMLPYCKNDDSDAGLDILLLNAAVPQLPSLLLLMGKHKNKLLMLLWGNHCNLSVDILFIPC